MIHNNLGLYTHKNKLDNKTLARQTNISLYITVNDF